MAAPPSGWGRPWAGGRLFPQAEPARAGQGWAGAVCSPPAGRQLLRRDED